MDARNGFPLPHGDPGFSSCRKGKALCSWLMQSRQVAACSMWLQAPSRQEQYIDVLGSMGTKYLGGEHLLFLNDTRVNQQATQITIHLFGPKISATAFAVCWIPLGFSKFFWLLPAAATNEPPCLQICCQSQGNLSGRTAYFTLLFLLPVLAAITLRRGIELLSI